MLMDRQETWLAQHSYGPALAIGGVIVLFGLAIVGLSIAGRRIGGMTACALLAIFFGLPCLAAVDATVGISGGPAVGRADWRPSANQIRSEYELGIGDARLDLTNIGKPSTQQALTYDVGIGQARLVLPPDVPTLIVARVDVGDIRTTLPEGWQIESEPGGRAVTTTAGHSATSAAGLGNEVIAWSAGTNEDGDGAKLHITVDLSIGHLSIYQGASS
jgi:hypothetical protein